MRKQSQEIFAINKLSGEIVRYPSMNACARALDATSGAVSVAVRNMGSVKGWTVLTKDTIESEINRLVAIRKAIGF